MRSFRTIGQLLPAGWRAKDVWSLIEQKPAFAFRDTAEGGGPPAATQRHARKCAASPESEQLPREAISYEARVVDDPADHETGGTAYGGLRSEL